MKLLKGRFQPCRSFHNWTKFYMLHNTYIYRVFQKFGVKVKCDKKSSMGRRDMRLHINIQRGMGFLYDTNKEYFVILSLQDATADNAVIPHYSYNARFGYKSIREYACTSFCIQYCVSNMKLFHWIMCSSALYCRDFERIVCCYHTKFRTTLNIYLQILCRTDPYFFFFNCFLFSHRTFKNTRYYFWN